MKFPRFKIWLACTAFLTAGGAAFGQSNGVPGPEDYTKFSHFIADRNIFDPTRQPHNASGPRRTSRPTRRNTETPGIQLVGVMTYEKGPFAFFNANSSENRKALKTGDKIAGYTVSDILGNSVKLESSDKKEDLTLKVGDGLREENGKWVPSSGGEISGTSSAPAASTSSAPSASANESNSEESGSAPAAPPPSALEQNDVLKRLMQLREQQNQ